MMLETLGVGLIIPALAVMVDPSQVAKISFFQPFIKGAGSQTELVVIGLVSLLVVYAVKAGFLAFLSWYQSGFAYRVQASLSQELFSGYLRQPYTFHLQRNSSELIRNVINETNHFTFNVMNMGITLLTEIFVVLGIAVLLVYVEPIGALWVVSVLGLAVYVFHAFTRSRISRWGEARQFHDGLRIQHLQEGLNGVKDVKILGREDSFLSQYAVHNVGNADVGKKQYTLQSLPRLWLEFLAVVGLVLIGFTMLVQGKPMTSLLPTMGLFAAAAFRLMPSVNRILNTIQSLRFSYPVINVLYTSLKEFKTIPPAVSSGKLSFAHDIKLENISYIYPESSHVVLQNVNMTVKKGSCIGIIGGSGAGKSTFVDLILGLLTPISGKIMVDGLDIQSNIRDWQDQIGYVPQNIYLTDDTIKNNVAFGLKNDEIDEAAIEKAIKAAQLDEFVRSLPEGLNTIVGERGVRLSGGQCQRIGIARALYRDPPVLILDEATSALDTKTEKEVMTAVDALKGKTLFIVAHRLTTLKHCDLIVKLEKGQIADTGLYDHFVNEQSLFQKNIAG
ncbi:ABC transporter ATP-binding protein/permease [bacterium]|nr:ABC transporter ATP-binding protein/permease [bacterium]